MDSYIPKSLCMVFSVEVLSAIRTTWKRKPYRSKIFHWCQYFHNGFKLYEKSYSNPFPNQQCTCSDRL